MEGAIQSLNSLKPVLSIAQDTSAKCLLQSYHDTGEVKYLEQLIAFHKVSTAATDETRIALGEALLLTFERTWNISILEQAMLIFETVCNSEHISSDTHIHPRAQVGLVEALMLRSTFHVNMDDTRRARDLLRSILSLDCPTITKIHAVVAFLALPSHVYDYRWGAILTQEDLMVMRSYLYEGLMLEASRDLNIRMHLSLMLLHNEPSSSVSSYDTAITLGNSVMKYITVFHPLRWAVITRLTTTYLGRGLLSQSIADLEAARDLMPDAEYMASCHDWARAVLVFRKSQTSTYRVQMTGALEDVEEALPEAQAAWTACQAFRPMRPRILNILSYLLGTHFEMTGRASNLDMIIALASEEFDTLIGWAAINTSEAMLYRFEVAPSFSVNHLPDTAINLLTRTLNTTSDDRERSATVSLLNKAYRLQGISHPDVNSQERVQFARKAHQQSASEGIILWSDVGRNSSLSVLIDALLSHAERASSVDHLEEAERLILSALEPSHSVPHTRAELRFFRARAQVIRSLLADKRDFLSEAWDTFESTVSDMQEPAWKRFDMALQWATLAEQSGDPQAIFAALRLAVPLVQRIGYLGQNVVGRMGALRQARGLPSRIAAAALHLGNVEAAIELLEQARGVLWTQSLYLRTPSTAVPPSLAPRMINVVKKLDSDDGPASEAAQRHADTEEFESLLREVRAVPGFERFLLPHVFRDLQRCSEKGIIVLIIPSSVTCHVVVLNSGGGNPPRQLSLPALNVTELQRLAKQFTSMNNVARQGMPSFSRLIKKVGVTNAAMHDAPSPIGLLSDLWTKLVRPIIENVSLQRTDLSKRPRLWWCPSGPLTFLPLHAAGIFEGPDEDNTSNYVISSYTPTLSALLKAQDAKTAPAHASVKILASAQPEVSGRASLPNARREMDVIHNLLPPSMFLGTAAMPTSAGVQTIIQNLPQASVLHLACHAQQDLNDPLDSGFDLADGRLTLGQLMKLDLPRAQLAYLSSCQSAAVDENHPDEALNLAAVMLFMGFKSVVATMWEMNDIDGPFVAERVYKRIFCNGMLDLSAVPYALDETVRELRQTGVSPSRWATYVHIGA